MVHGPIPESDPGGDADRGRVRQDLTPLEDPGRGQGGLDDVSHDLGYEFEYLKTAYARLLEQWLLSQPGLLVVELAEARAISQELALADAGARIERRLPLYLSGE